MTVPETELGASVGGPQVAPHSGDVIVQAQNLVKRYGRLTAVDGVSFAIQRGEIFGLLGPNGAGKSTTLDILEGIRAADSGTVVIDGLDVRRNRRAIQARIGVQLQTTSLFEYLQVRETLALFGSFYPKAIAPETLLREVALEEKAHAYPQDLSGGQRQRLALALALVNDPTLVFLDEPTSGLDPQSRRLLWEQVQRLRERGKTVVLTTHFMDEAQILCDRIAIMDNGRIIAQDTPAALIATLGASAAIECALVSDATGAPILVDELRSMPGVTEARLRDGSALIYTDQLEATLVALLRLAGDCGTQIERLQTHAPTLEDVFLKLTGRGLRD
ncbi:MAG TPA: ABC transporter ATP-binding protein [Ktedonobacterales bacterium]|jgi:ABC-2 type transport system ATP-binding protein|nr:ABC transporter ATP-binding protein [Ktedonobacterales bacterium]